MKRLALGEKFTLTFTVRKDDAGKVAKMMEDNKIIYSFVETGFGGFIVVECCANIRKAEIIRVLLKNIKVYD